MLTTKAIAKHLKIGTHGSTYGGNPLACSVAETVLDVVNTPEVLEGVKAKEALFKSELEKINAEFSVFDQVRGKGLLIGAVLKDETRSSKRFP